jgi:hypothetical protein
MGNSYLKRRGRKRLRLEVTRIGGGPLRKTCSHRIVMCLYVESTGGVVYVCSGEAITRGNLATQAIIYLKISP